MDLTVITLDSIGVVTIIGGSILAIMSRLPKETIVNQKALITSYEQRFADIERQRNEDNQNYLHERMETAKATAALREEDKKNYTSELLENSKAIADLQGQIKVYKELPLQEMAAALQDISKSNKTIQTIASTNQAILSTLNKSALIAATDRTEPGTVTEQHVVNQTVERSIVNREPVSEH